MDRRSKHLSSEERGVIFASIIGAAASGQLGAFWVARQARFAGNWRVVDKMTAAIARRADGWFMICAGSAVAARAS